MPHPIEKYRGKYNLWVNDQVLLLTHVEIDELIELIRVKNPGYSCMTWCGHCVGEMFKLAFKLYESEVNLSSNPQQNK